MSKKVLYSLVVICMGALAFAGSASAQWTAPVKVSDAIEGGTGGVSVARCGNTVVAGFADAEPNNANSFDGAAVSRDGGKSFIDRGVLPVPPPDPNNGAAFLGVDSGGSTFDSNPAVACASPNLLYYASVYSPGPAIPGCGITTPGCTAISVSKSTNGGTTWGLPVVTAFQGADVFSFFSPTIAVDPTNPMRMYVAFMVWDLSSFFGASCDSDAYEVVVVRSTDGGVTWSQPVRPDHACNGFAEDASLIGTMRTPNIIVSPDGTVDLTDEFVGQSGNPNAIHFLRSTDHGSTFSAPITVSTNAIANAQPQLAVDRTTSSFRGAIYLTWSGKPRGTTTEVLLSDSLNHGASFSFPRSVRSTSVGTQVNPVTAVDNDGQVATCYYVTGTNTPTSTSSYFYNCLTSFNHGATWASYQKLVSSAPIGYDALTSDFTLANDGFFTAFELQSSTGQRRVVGSISDNP